MSDTWQKWSNKLTLRLRELYSTDGKIKPGHEPAGIKPKEPRETRQILPQREDNGESMHADG